MYIQRIVWAVAVTISAAAYGAERTDGMEGGPVCSELRADGAALPPMGCWEEAANQPGCFLWNLYPKPEEAVHWSGACRNELAHDEGEAVWYINGEQDNITRGAYQAGKRHGRFLIRKMDGETWSGAYFRGKRQGPWIERYADGTVAKGMMLHGKRHGWWLRRNAAGNPLEKTLWQHGEQATVTPR